MVYPTSKINTATNVRNNSQLANKTIKNLHIKQFFYNSYLYLYMTNLDKGRED